MKRGGIGLGDLAEALATLRPNGAVERRSIAMALGFELDEETGSGAAADAGSWLGGRFDPVRKKREYLASSAQRERKESVPDEEAPLLEPVEVARPEPRQEAEVGDESFPYDAFVSSGAGETKFVAELKSALEREGFRLWEDADQAGPGETVSQSIRNGMESSRHALWIRGSRVPKWQESDMELFEQLGRSAQPRGITVIAPGGKADPGAQAMIQLVTGMAYIDMRQGVTQKALDELVEALSSGRPRRRFKFVPADSHRLEVPCLFEPNWQTQILIEMLSSDLELGPVDLKRLLRRVCSLRPIEELPRRLNRALLGPIELLIDISDGMAPYAADREEVRREVVHLLRDSVAVKKFRDCPILGCGEGLPHRWQPYRPASPGTLVVVVGHFGSLDVMEGASVRDWLAFFDLCSESGCPVVGLSPTPPGRIHPELAGQAAFIEWDRGTTIGTVRDALLGG